MQIVAVLIFGALVTAAYGLAVERIAYRRLRRSTRLAPLISAIGVSIFLAEFRAADTGRAGPRRCRRFSRAVSPWGATRRASTSTLSYLQLLVAVLTVGLMTVFTLVITRTDLGRAQRATAQDRTMTALLGIDVDRTVAITFVMGAMLAAVAGLMSTMFYGVIDFSIGFSAGIKAFTAAVLGGIGSLPGAMLGGLLPGHHRGVVVGLPAVAIPRRRLLCHPRGGADRPPRRAAGPEGNRESLMRVRLTRMLWAALIAGLVLLPSVGIHIEDGSGSSSLTYHLVRAAILTGLAAAVAGFGRLPRLVHFSVPSIAMPHPLRRMAISLAMLLAVALPFLPGIGREGLDLATLVIIYAVLGAGLNIVVGFAGLLDLGFIGFFAIGAYTYALLATQHGLGFWAALPLAAALPALTSLLLGVPVLRLRGDYFAIVTLGFGQIVYTLLVNCEWLTHGSQGIAGIPRASLFGLATFSATGTATMPSFTERFGVPYSPVQRLVFFYYLALVLLATVNLLAWRLRRLPLGRAWEAVREDEIAAASIGIRRATVKLAAYAIGAATAGVAGAFFAARQGFVSPESFTFMDSAIVLAIVVLGGMGNQLGTILAAAFLIGAPELFRGLADYRMLIFGAGMVLIMLVRPRGLLSGRNPAVRLNPA